MGKWTDDEVARLIDLHNQELRHEQIAAALGRTRKSVEKKWDVVRPVLATEAQTIEGRVTSVAQLLELFDVDEDVWAVRNARVNTWEQHSLEAGIVPLYQARADLIPLIPPRDAAVMDELKAEPKLEDMPLIMRGQRLSVMPITKEHFEVVRRMGRKK